MVAKAGPYQATFNAGELAPELHGNWSLKQFYAGLARAENLQPIPQGGMTLLPRSRFYADLGPPAAPARLLPFTYSLTDAYVISLEPGAARIYKAGALVATLALPYAAADLAAVRAVQRYETMILWHQNYPPRRIVRQGSDAAWTTDVISWLSMPQVDYGAGYTNVNDVWTVYVQWTSGSPYAGINITVSVDGEATSVITLQAAHTDTAPQIKAAIEALETVDPGIAVSFIGSNAVAASWSVTFSGGRNSGANFSVSGTSSSTSVAVNTWRTAKGVVGGEDVMSTARGWPRCGVFFQDRLVSAGFRAKPSAWLASRTGEYFDANIKLTVDSGAMLINLDADGAETLVHVVQGAYLGFFTTDGMYHLADRALKATQPPNLVKSPQAEGASPRVPPIIQEGTILYVNRAETIVYSATYDAVSTTMQTAPLSVLASHLIVGISGAALQKSHSATDAQRYFLVRDDGMLIVACLLRNQDVQPFVRWTTDGQVRAVCVDGANVVWLLVDRTVNGVTRRYLEALDDTLLLDAAVTITLASPATVVPGLGVHEGRQVWAIADGWTTGPYTVAGGAITLPFAASSITAGRWSPPVATTLPLPRDVGNRVVLKRPARVHTVTVDLMATTSLAIAANGGAVRPVTLARAGDPVDTPTPARTGEITITGLAGFSADGSVTLTQLRPGALQIRDITIQART